jgi:transposase
MIVIGADTHKRNHMLVAVDGQTGARVGQRAIAASDAGSLDALRFAAGLDQERVWAIEDCRHVSARLEAALIAAGERVVRVPAAMTGQARRVPASSGNTQRHRLHRGGDRQLNRAIHIIALSRARNPRLSGSQTRRGQNQARSHPLPQAPPRPPHLATALLHPDPGRPPRADQSLKHGNTDIHLMS